MSEPLISIVLPTSNGSRYIGDAIESCIHQTCQDWELLVVDDGSRDNTVEIVQVYERRDQRIRLIRHGENLLLPAAVNTGFRNARGRFFTWIADDNMYRPEALQAMVEFLEHHPDVGIVYTDTTVIDEAGMVIKHRPSGEPDRMLLDPNPIGWCFMFRQSVWKTVGEYDPSTFLAEDYDFWLRASRQFKFAVLHRDLYMYRQQPDSLTQTRTKECRWAAAHVERKNLPYLTWPKKEDKALLYYEIASLAWRRRQYGQMIDCWLHAFCSSRRYTLVRAFHMVVRKCFRTSAK